MALGIGTAMLDLMMEKARRPGIRADGGGRQFQRTYIREWRKLRGLTLERLAERLDMTASHMSMLERGQRGYTQETLEAIAEALQTDPASLIIRNPKDGDAIWSIWEQAKPAERELIERVVRSIPIRKTGS
jgi:transcriptional regulator with XRE-family HTH domain